MIHSQTAINGMIVRTESLGPDLDMITTIQDETTRKVLHMENHGPSVGCGITHHAMVDYVANGTLPPRACSLPELDFFEGILGDDRDYRAIVECTRQAIMKFDYWVCFTIEYALLCPPLAGQPRVTWQQIAEILKILKGVRS